MTTYYFSGISEHRLEAIAAAINERLSAGETHFVLKNGAEVDIYGSADDALLVDENDRECEFHHRFDLACEILRLSRSR